MTKAHGEIRLVVNGSQCDGHGICALVMPERISLDTWGFAAVDPAPLTDPRLVARARRVVHSCPAKALTLVGDPRAADVSAKADKKATSKATSAAKSRAKSMVTDQVD